MQGNELATYWSTYQVVTLVPTLMQPPQLTRRQRWMMRRQTQLEHYEINEMMCRWINQQGYQLSIPTSIWGFGDPEEFNALVQPVLRRCEEYIVRCEIWPDEATALANLYDPALYRVFDADSDRVDRLWRFNGVRVLPGGTP